MCVRSLSISILVAAVCLRGPIVQVQGNTLLSSDQGTQTRSLGENKSDARLGPESMQLRRFMWREVDETMDDIIEGVANGAKVMKEIISTAFEDEPRLVRFKKHAEFRQALPLPVNMRYVMKKTQKPTRVVKMVPHIPKKLVKMIPTKPFIHIEPSVVIEPVRRPQDDFKIDEKTLRDIEKEEEEKVEATISAILPNAHHEEIIVGKYKDDWEPVIPEATETPEIVEVPVFSTKKPHVVSPLHTNVLNITEVKKQHIYEVTENVAEETIQRPQTSRPTNENVNRRKGDLESEKYRPSEGKTRNHKGTNQHLTETSPSTAKPRPTVTTYQSARKIKVKVQKSENHSTTTPKSRSVRKEISPKVTATKESVHHRLKADKTKSDGILGESSKKAKYTSSRGSVKFGDKA